MKYCIHCGNELVEGEKFCRRCGSPAEVAQPNTQSVAAEPETQSVVVEPETQSVAAQPKTQSVVAKPSTATKGSAAGKSRKKIKKIWIVLGAVVLFLGIVAAVLFAPRNLEMDDFKKTNVVTAIIKYGIPESINSNEDGVCLLYGLLSDCKVDFYGITPNIVFVYPDDDRVTFWFGDDDGYDVYRIVDRYCDFETNILDVYHVFSYGDLEITTDDYDGTYVSIKMY